MKFFLTTLLFLTLFCCTQSTSDLPTEDALSHRLDSYLQKTIDRLEIPGLTVSATRNDTVVYTGAFGFRNYETKEPMKPDNIFHWASVSKTFVATAILQLVEQGKINLDEKLIAYVPYFRQKEQWHKEITIRQMLNHTSGIGDVDDYEWDKPQHDEGAPERYVRSLKNDNMRFAPGKDWAYSNTAYEILGVVITRVSGMPFETYIKKNILEPLEMKQTSFIYPEIPDSLRVNGHVWAPGPIISKVYPYNRIHAPSSTLNSNVTEMTHYAMANLHRGEYKSKRILADSTYNLLWTNSVTLPDKPQIGASWFLEDHKGIKIVSHSGGDTGFRSYLLLVPEKNISVMVACNYELARTRDIGFAVLAILTGNKPEEIKTQIGFAFAEKLKKEGLDKARDFYTKTKADSTAAKNYIWEEDEGAFAYPGYQLLDANMYTEAIELFKLNLEQFPSSAWAAGHLGVAYARSGDKKLAKQYLIKAKELMPAEAYFKDELGKL